VLLKEITQQPAHYPEMEHDGWIPASGGTETEFKSRSGKRLLYCWNPKLKQHAYIDLDSDVVLSDEEARAALQTY
jgi:hypothetical protein